MANTERLQVMRRVHEARKAVESALSKDDLDTQARKILQETSDKLETLQDRLFLEELGTRVQRLVTDSRSLGMLAGRMRKSVKGLKRIADTVEKAAKSVKLLVDIMSKVTTL